MAPEANIGKLYRMIKLFNMVCFIWCRRSLNLLEKVPEALEFHTQLPVATLIKAPELEPRQVWA